MVKTIKYNIAQLLFILSFAKITILEWGRGTGKSTILAKRMIDCAVQLPRSNGVLVAETYQQILTRTLPSTIAGLEQHGIYKDVHYFVGRKPPKHWNWPEPYEPPLDYKRCLIFWTGCVVNFLSQDHSAGSGRGMNNDFVIGDEAVRLNKQKFDTDVMLTNRGNLNRLAIYPDGTVKKFKDVPLHHSVLLASSTPITSQGQWFLDYEKKAIEDPINYKFIRASAEVNRENLGEEYFKNAKDTLPDFLYKAEVENIRISRITDGFYPLLNESKHCYNEFNYDVYESFEDKSLVGCLGDADLWLDEPLTIGVDWGANFNCLVVNQNQNGTERILNNFYVKYPKIIDNLIKDEFLPYYQHHRNKLIYFWYDPSGNVSMANSNLTYAEQATKLLKEGGWQVVMMTKGMHNVLHQDKYNLWNKLLDNDNEDFPNVQFNKTNCNELWISMTNAPAKQGRREAIIKDKKSESNKTMDQSHATHFSDAIDVIMVGKYLNQLKHKQEHIDTSFTR